MTLLKKPRQPARFKMSSRGIGALGTAIVGLLASTYLASTDVVAAPISVKSIEGETSAPLMLLLSKATTSNALVQTTLKTQLPAASSNISLRQTAAIALPNGSRIFKYTRLFHDIPILNDWASMQLSPEGRVNKISYHVTQPLDQQLDQELDQALNQDIEAARPLKDLSQLWALDQQSVLQTMDKHPTLSPLADSGKRVWFKRDNTLLPAYSISANKMVNGRPALFSLVISASNAELLAKYALSHDLTAYNYTIYADGDAKLPHQTPYGDLSPHPTGTPSATPPSGFVSQSSFAITELSHQIDDPWLPDGASETVGNNVDVFFNFTRGTDGIFDFFGDGYGPQYRVRGDAFDLDFRAPITNGSLNFTYAPANYQTDYDQLFDSASDPSEAQIQAINAQQVQAFYLANLLHDVFYDAGFTESAGNAQMSNFGRGGIEGDPLIAHINSFTFVTAPADGTSPVIHLGRSRGGSTAFDTTIFAHEWTHYMFRRLVNHNVLIDNNQSSAINEGWADVVGVLMSMKPNHVASNASPGFSSSYALGSYFKQEIRNDATPDPFFFGIRRYPYGPNNPFKFGHIAHKAALPSGITFSDYSGRSSQNSQVHSAGEIWADAVLSCFRDALIQRTATDFDTKRQLLASYVVSAMANTPPNPTFLEARNALLGAIKQTSESDFQACRFRFALKGMGSAAVAPPRDSITFEEVVESVELNNLHLSIVTSELKDNLSSLDGDGILDYNERGQLILTVQNTGFESIDNATLSLAEPSLDYQVISPAAIQVNNLAPGQKALVALPVRLLHERHFDLSSFPINFVLTGANLNWERNYQLTASHRTHYDLATQATSSPINSQFKLAMRDWTLNRVLPQYYADSKWEEVTSANNGHLFELQEPTLATEGLVSRAWESPWMQRSNSGALTLSFNHAFELDQGDAHIEISQNGTDWTPFTGVSSPYNGVSTGFPSLVAQSLENLDITAGTLFKVRFRTEAFAPLSWQLNNFAITGVVRQPFTEILPEDGKDTSGVCFPVKATAGVAVVCL